MLVKAYGEPVLDPPAREGMEERAPFLLIPYDVMRKGVAQVCGANSTDMRGAVEAHLVQDAAMTGQLHQARSLQLFVGHDAGASLKHYHKESSKAISENLQKIMKNAERKQIKEQNPKKAKKQKKGKQ